MRPPSLKLTRPDSTRAQPDGAWWYEGDAMAAFLRPHPRLRLNDLPRSPPGLNPQERVWRRIRHEATTYRWFAELDAIWTTVHKAHRSWPPQKLKRLCHVG